MTATIAGPGASAVPLPPKNPLPYWRRLTATRRFDTGFELLRDSGGSVTRNVLGPRWIMPPLVIVSSPKGAHDILARTDAFAERAATPIALEIRRLMGDNLLVVPHHKWLPRRRELQPIFTKHHVPRFGGRMAEVAELRADRWALGATVDLDADCRAMTLRALGRSILGIDLGHDTTSTALTYALWALGHRPDLQQRVAAEAGALGNGRLTHEDVPQLRYTVQVLHEALRLCPPAPAVGRMVMADIEVDGYLLSAGTVALVAIYAIHRDPASWEDPLRFDPDRFSPERCNGRDRWQYLPFGGGPRACIGDHFAMLEATLALATILRRVEIVSQSGDFPTITPLTMIAAAPSRANAELRVNR